MAFIKKIAGELKKEKGELNVVYVDWASAFQHKNNGTPIRDITDFPVIQSPFWSEATSFQKTWQAASGRPPAGGGQKGMGVWDDVAIMLDAEGKVADVFEFGLAGKKRKSLKNGASYEEFKRKALKAYGT